MKKLINKHNRLSFVFSAIPIIIHIVLYIVYKVNAADDDLSDLISSMGEFVIILPLTVTSPLADTFSFLRNGILLQLFQIQSGE